MAVTNQDQSSPIYVCNGVTTVFSTGFSFTDPESLLVQTRNPSTDVITTLVYLTDYTVDVALDDDNLNNVGSITCTVAPASGLQLVIVMNLDFLQETRYPEGTSFSGATHERALDKLTFELIQLKYQLSLIPSLSNFGTVTGDLLTLPQPLAPSDSPTFNNLTLTGVFKGASIATIASASTTDLATLTSNIAYVSGTATINSLGSMASGSEITLIFTGAGTLTHNATSLILPSGANITRANGDSATFISLTPGNWRCTDYQTASGQALIGGGAGVGTVTSITASSGLSGGVITTSGTLAVNITGQTLDASPDAANDEIMTYDMSAGSLKKIKLNQIISSGTVSQVTAGLGLAIGTTYGGNFTTSGTINLDINNLVSTTTPSRTADYVAVYTTSTATIKKVLIKDLQPGTVSSVTAGTGLSGGTITNSGTVALSIDGLTSVTPSIANDYVPLYSASALDQRKALLSTLLPTSGVLTTSSPTFVGLTLTAALNQAQGADIASAATTNLGSATGNFVNITGNSVITSFGTAAAGVQRAVRFAGALTLTHNATSLILPNNGSDITTTTNDTALFVSEGSGNWRCLNYTRYSGSAVTTVLSPAAGGTGMNNGSSVIGLSGNLLTSGGYNLSFNLSGDTSIILPTTGVLLTNTVSSLTSLSAVGTIYTGTWAASVITGAYGGTGVNNGSRTLTLGGNLTTAGAYAATLQLTDTTYVTLPPSGTLLSTASNYVSTLTGTVNQVNTSASVGAVTLSLPQDIHTAASPTFASVTNTGIVKWSRGADITLSSGTLTLGTDGNYFHINFNSWNFVSINTLQAGTRVLLLCNSTTIITHNATSFILPTAANISAAVGDVMEFVSEGSGNWRCVNYQRADGTALSSSSGAPTTATYVTLSTSSFLSSERVLTGTTNQVVLTDGGAGGNITLSLPQDIHTGASPTFAGITSTGLNLWAKGTDIASAPTILSGGFTANYFHVTGNTPITTIAGKQAGTILILEFDSSLILRHNASTLILPAGVNITTRAGDIIILISEGTPPASWRCINYLRADGTPLYTNPDDPNLWGAINRRVPTPSTSGYVLTSNGSTAVPSWQAAPGGGSTSALTTNLVAGETITAGQLVYMKSDGKVWLSKAAGTTAEQQVLGIAQESKTATQTISILIYGLDNMQTGLTVGTKYYLSDTYGGLTSTPPTASGSIVMSVGTATSTTSLVFSTQVVGLRS